MDALLFRQLTESQLPTALPEPMRTNRISISKYHGTTIKIWQHGLALIAQQPYDNTNNLGNNLPAQAGRSEILRRQMVQHRHTTRSRTAVGASLSTE